MGSFLSIVKTTAILGGIPEEIIERDILPIGKLQEYAKGQFLVEPQQEMNRIGILISGSVHILHMFPEGSYSLMSVLRKGSVLGADLIFTRTKAAPYHAVAASCVQVMYLPAQLLTHPGMMPENWRVIALTNTLTLISNENIKKEYRLAILSQKGLRERILTYLSMQVAKRQTATIEIPFSREELAAFLCVNRSALSHELSLMQQEGIISFHKNKFTFHREPVQ